MINSHVITSWLTFLLFFQLQHFLCSCFTQTSTKTNSFLCILNLLEYEIRDLETNTQSCFTTEGLHWISSFSDPTSQPIFECSGTYLIGGLDWMKGYKQTGHSFKRSYTNLPVHNVIRYTFSYWALDSWDSNEDDRIYIQFDSMPKIPGWKIDKTKNHNPEHLCGNTNYRDVRGIRVFGWVFHTAQTLDFSIISGLSHSTNDESFGIRNFSFLFMNEISPPISEFVCARSENVTLKSQTLCICKEDQYSPDSTSTNCINCHPSCASCFGPTNKECYECNLGYFFNGEVCTNCYESCSKCWGNSSHECLECIVGYVLLNGVCIPSSCFTPFYVTDACTGNCIDSCTANDHLDWSGSCSLMCQGNEVMDSDGACKGLYLLDKHFYLNRMPKDDG